MNPCVVGALSIKRVRSFSYKVFDISKLSVRHDRSAHQVQTSKAVAREGLWWIRNSRIYDNEERIENGKG